MLPNSRMNRLKSIEMLLKANHRTALKTFRSLRCVWTVANLFFATTSIVAHAQSTGTTSGEAMPPMTLQLSDSIAQGHLLLEVRPRYALITESAKREKTDVWTVRTSLGWQTAPFYDVRLTAEFLYVDFLGASGRVNTDPSKFFASNYPLLPDPPYSGVNQLFADYGGFPSTRVKLGRQILRIDDERFISDVDFRQTPQVFDGVTIVNTSLPQTRIQLGEYRRIRTVLGGLNDLRLHVLHAAWNPLPDHTLAGYGYWHDQAATGAQTGFANNAQRIVGAHAEGGFALDESWRWMYYAGVARQNQYGNGDSRIDANYRRIGMGIQTAGSATFGTWGARIDREVKGSNGGIYGFQTPLTDYYAFNGWALQYTSTPRVGLIDTWLTARGQMQKLSLFTEYHRFRSDFGGLTLGREFDVSVTYPITPTLVAKLQQAQFRAGSGASVKNDVDKIWFTLTYKY
ncbi:MAG: hypothetical protein IPO38_07535 [Rhodocyclaceae bacterium]|nr:hypothetical protein [Rhodocyclaceae bacterium]